MRILLWALLATTACLQAQIRPQAFKLPNGLQVLLLEDHEHALVRARLHLRVEPADLPAGRQGLPLLAMGMFAHSDAADLTDQELDRSLDESGIQLSPSTEADGLEWQLASRSRDQDRAMSLLADRLLRSMFEPSLLESQRLACWRQVEGREVDPHARLRQALAQAPESQPTLASLSAITWEDLLTFRAKVVRPDRGVLVLHGDLGLEQAKRLVLLTLGSWSAQEPPQTLDAPKPASAPSAVVPKNLLTFPAAGAGLRVQAVAPQPAGLAPEIAHLLSLLVPGDGSLYPVGMVAEGACLLATFDAAPGSSGSSAWTMLHGRLEALRQRGFSQADLERARLAWTAARSLSSLHPEAQMATVLDEALSRAATPERVKAVSLEALNAGLRRWLDPVHLRSGAAGDRELLGSLPKP